MAKRAKQATAAAVQEATIQDEKPPAAETATAVFERPAADPPAGPNDAAVDPFPQVIKTANIDGYRIRLQQSRESNQVQIKFGDGSLDYKPSDDVLEVIKNQTGPRGQHFTWNQADRAWGMSIRDNGDLATRETARRAFDQVVEMVREQLGAARER